MASTATKVQFAKGFKSGYFSGENNTYPSEFNGIVYFSSDTNEIYVDGEAYGIGGKIVEQLKANNFVSSVNLITDTSTGEQHLDFVYYDKDGLKQNESINLFKIIGDGPIVVEHVTIDVSVGENEIQKVKTQDYKISLKLSENNSYLKNDNGLKIDTQNFTSDKMELGESSGLKDSSTVYVSDFLKEVNDRTVWHFFD